MRNPMYEFTEGAGLMATCNACDRIIFDDENDMKEYKASGGYCQGCRKEMKGSGYKTLIIKDCGCTPEEVAEVEDIMRYDVFHSTLDWQSPMQFRKGAKDAYQIYKILKKQKERMR